MAIAIADPICFFCSSVVQRLLLIGSFLRRLSSLCRGSADKVLVPVQRCFCASRRKCSTAFLIGQ